jgi:hypothetical protein
MAPTTGKCGLTEIRVAHTVAPLSAPRGAEGFSAALFMEQRR